MVVQIKIDQAGKPAGVAGKAREDLALGVAVVLTAVGGPFSAHQWTITYKPPNAALSALSAAVLSAPLASSTNLAPIDNAGTYNIRLLVNSGSGLGASVDDVADITFYAGPTLNSDPMLLPRRIPAAFEQGQHNVNDALFPTGNPMGWALEWERWFRFIETAASVSYVNSVVQGLKAKEAVRLLADTNIALTGVQVIDLLNTATGDRIYVVGNTDPIENGIYVANDVGAWTRALDMAAGSSAAGVYAFVREGAVGHADTGWICETDAPNDIVGTDPLSFVLFTALPLATAAPLDVTKSAAVVGVSGKAAREDHKHDIATAVPVSVGVANAEGVAATLARSDHVHAGTALTAAAPADVTKAAAAVGVATAAARADHKHDVTTAAPPATGVATASSEGVATTLARSDHAHQSNTAPASVTKAAAVIGVSGEPARADHKHDIDTAAPVSVGVANAEGVASTLARSDHVHEGLALTAVAPVDVTKSAAAVGVAAAAARADHKHDVTTAVPVNVTKVAAAEGTATSLARSDHKHDVTTAAPTSIGTANAEGSATSLARSDHVHQGRNPYASLVLESVNWSAQTNNFAIGASTDQLSVTLTGSQNLSGVAAPTPLSAKQYFTLLNSDDVDNLTILHLSGSSSGANQILCPCNVNLVVGPRQFVLFEYLAGGAWMVTTPTLAVVVPADVTKATAALGVSTTAARADHKHDVTTAAPGATGVATASADGAATTLARSDHAHQSNTAPVNVTKAAAAIGTSGEPARADHKHDVTTAAPVSLGTANAEGTATSLARSDHVHAGLSGSFDTGEFQVNVPNLTIKTLYTLDFAALPGQAVPFGASGSSAFGYVDLEIDDAGADGTGIDGAFSCHIRQHWNRDNGGDVVTDDTPLVISQANCVHLITFTDGPQALLRITKASSYDSTLKVRVSGFLHTRTYASP